jgi:SH3-like domain-containing protein
MQKFLAIPGGFRRLAAAGALWLATLSLAGCGLFGGASTAPTPLPTRTPFPTFTPTVAAPTATPAPVATQAAPATEATPAAEAAAPTPMPVAVAASKPRLTISSDAVNVRRAPSTDAELLGMVTAGQQYDVTGRTPASDWWQICCIDGQSGWVFGELATVMDGDTAPVAAVDAPTASPALAEAPAATEAPAPVEATPTTPPAVATEAPPAAAPDPAASSAGWFDPNAQYQIVHFKVLGLEENNGGIRDSSAQHLIFLTVLDQNGNGVDGAVVRNLVGDKSEVVTGGKGPGKAEITMYYEPFKLAVASDPSGAVTSQVSNQMGLIFPHLPDLVGKLGDVNYEYGACPTIDIKCSWPLSAIHFSYEITFQKVK